MKSRMAVTNASNRASYAATFRPCSNTISGVAKSSFRTTNGSNSDLNR